MSDNKEYLMGEFLRKVDITKNRLLRHMTRGDIDLGRWEGTGGPQPYRVFTEADVEKAQAYFSENFGTVTISPKGEEVHPDSRWVSVEQAAKLTGVAWKTIVKAEKQGRLPPPKWTRKPFPKRVYGKPDLRRIVEVIRGEDTAMKWTLEVELEGADLSSVVANDDDDKNVVDLFE